MARKSFPPQVCFLPTTVILVTTVDAKGKPNIITLAWDGVVNTAPPMIGISIRKTAYSNKCLKDSMEFVVNLPSEGMEQGMNICGTKSGRNSDKFKLTGWKQAKAEIVKPPLIDECAINIECIVKKIIPLDSHDLFLGEVLKVHKKEEILTGNGTVDIGKFMPVVYMPYIYEYWSIGKPTGSTSRWQARF